MAVVVTRPDIWQGRVGPCRSESRQCPFSANDIAAEAHPSPG